MTTIATTGLAQMTTNEKQWKANIEAAIDGAVGNNALTSANIFVGNASNVAAGVAVTGVVDLDNTGKFTWDSAWMNVATTSSNGELTIADMTSNGGIIVLPRASTGTNGPITHQTAAAGKVTLFYDGTTNVAASLSVAYAVVKL